MFLLNMYQLEFYQFIVLVKSRCSSIFPYQIKNEYQNFDLLHFQTLTSQIGKILELEDVDNGIDDYRSTTFLTFEQYRYYLFKEVFE